MRQDSTRARKWDSKIVDLWDSARMKAQHVKSAHKETVGAEQ
jgi:hypothetical protein